MRAWASRCWWSWLLLGLAFLLLPLVGLSSGRLGIGCPSCCSRESSRSALRLSLMTASLATVVSLVLGVPLAVGARPAHVSRAQRLRALVTLPLVLPPVVGGVALFLAFGRTRPGRRPLSSHRFGITLPFTTAAVVVAETFVAMPFLVFTVEGALRAADLRLRGGRRDPRAPAGSTVLRRVTLPLIMPSLAAGAVLCWARALGEFGATITFAGNLPGAHPDACRSRSTSPSRPTRRGCRAEPRAAPVVASSCSWSLRGTLAPGGGRPR